MGTEKKKNAIEKVGFTIDQATKMSHSARLQLAKIIEAKTGKKVYNKVFNFLTKEDQLTLLKNGNNSLKESATIIHNKEVALEGKLGGNSEKLKEYHRKAKEERKTMRQTLAKALADNIVESTEPDAEPSFVGVDSDILPTVKKLVAKGMKAKSKE